MIIDLVGTGFFFCRDGAQADGVVHIAAATTQGARVRALCGHRRDRGQAGILSKRLVSGEA